MKKLILLIAFFACLSPLLAQPTFTKDDFMNGYSTSGQYDQYSSTDLTGLDQIIATKGAGVSWTLTDRTWTKTTGTAGNNILHTMPGTAPYPSDPDFSAATHYEFEAGTGTDPNTYSYYKIADDGMYLVGQAQDSAGVTSKVMVLTPPTKMFQFPLTYGTTWTSTSSVKSDVFEVPDGATMSLSISGEGDAYGSLTTPLHTTKQYSPTATNTALRLKWSFSLKGTYLGFDIPINSIVNYEFFSGNNYSMTIPTNPQSSAPTSVSYTVGQATGNVEFDIDNPLTIKLSANPVSNHTALSYNLPESGDVKVSMMDNLGREVKMLHNGFAPAGSNVIPIDPSTMANGTYLVRVSSNSFTGTRKLIIAK